MMGVNCGDNMVTFSGKYINPDGLKRGDICIEDIAQGLSNMTRFSGQCREFYSVAQHSVMVAQNTLEEATKQGMRIGLAKEFARIALLHDAPEAYCSDLVRCVKGVVGARYKDLEYDIWTAVVTEFELEPLYSMLADGENLDPLPAIVHYADMRMLVTERRDLIVEQDMIWDLQETHEPYPQKIKPMLPQTARAYFMGFYKELFA